MSLTKGKMLQKESDSFRDFVAKTNVGREEWIWNQNKKELSYERIDIQINNFLRLSNTETYLPDKIYTCKSGGISSGIFSKESVRFLS